MGSMKNLLGDLKNPLWIHFKGWLFLLLAGIASVCLLVQHPTLANVVLLAIAI